MPLLFLKRDSLCWNFVFFTGILYTERTVNPLDKKHRGSIWWITILIAGLLLLLCSGMILRGISSIAQLFRTFLLGIMIAFVLNQPSKLIQNALTKKANWREKPAKAVGILGAYLFIFALLAAVIGIVIPQMIDSVRTFALNMDAYLNNLQQELDRITIPLGVQRIDLSNLIDLAHAGLGKMDAAVVPHILSVTGTMLQALGTLAISIAFSVYLLAGKERILSQGNRVLRAYLPKQTYEQTHSVVRVIVDCFRNYLIGQTTEAVILGSLCFVGMLILGLEYAGVVSVTVGVTAMIPILGAYIGGVVAMILLFMIAPWKALVFLVFFVILQQVENNVIYPRVVGGRLGLPGIWVLLAITVGGQIGGVVGMLLGVPITTVLYTLLRNSVRSRESKKSSP